MYVCICRGVTDKTIKSLIINNGASSLKDVQNFCGAGGDCRTCVYAIKKIVSGTIESRLKSS